MIGRLLAGGTVGLVDLGFCLGVDLGQICLWGLLEWSVSLPLRSPPPLTFPCLLLRLLMLELPRFCSPGSKRYDEHEDLVGDLFLISRDNSHGFLRWSFDSPACYRGRLLGFWGQPDVVIHLHLGGALYHLSDSLLSRSFKPPLRFIPLLSKLRQSDIVLSRSRAAFFVSRGWFWSLFVPPTLDRNLSLSVSSITSGLNFC